MVTNFITIILTGLLCKTIMCLPYDDGKYSPGKYSPEDGKYYRPRYEGKYIPTDEGKYTYIYRHGIYPTDNRDYRYIHETGPNGPGEGPEGSDGPNNSYDPFWNEYIGYKIYADKYPYVHDVIEALIDKYVSKSFVLYGDGLDVNQDFFKRLQPSETDGMSAVKCEYVEPKLNNSDSELKRSEAIIESMLENSAESKATVTEPPTIIEPESTTKLDQDQYNFIVNSLPSIYPKKGEDVGQFYSFKGLNSILVVSNDKHTKKKMKLQYEITVRVIDEDTVVE